MVILMGGHCVLLVDFSYCHHWLLRCKIHSQTLTVLTCSDHGHIDGRSQDIKYCLAKMGWMHYFPTNHSYFCSMQTIMNTLFSSTPLGMLSYEERKTLPICTRQWELEWLRLEGLGHSVIMWLSKWVNSHMPHHKA